MGADYRLFNFSITRATPVVAATFRVAPPPTRSVALFLRGAHVSRVLAVVSRHRELFPAHQLQRNRYHAN